MIIEFSDSDSDSISSQPSDENDFCNNFANEGRVETIFRVKRENGSSKKINDLFKQELTSNNVLTLKDDFSQFSFFMIEKINKVLFDGTQKKFLHTEDYVIDKQIVDYIQLNGDKICRSDIGEGYITNMINEADYKFIASSTVDVSGKQCEVLAFRFLKDLDVKLYYLYKFKIIHSILVCAVKMDKEIKMDGGSSLLINPGFGSFLTFKSAQYARQEGFLYYFMRAVNLGIIKVYMDWGFHFGLPFLNLDNVYLTFADSEIVQYWINKPDLSKNEVSIQLELVLQGIVKKELKYQLFTSYRLSHLILDMKRSEWEDERKKEDPFEPYCLKISKFIVTTGESLCMYMDLYSSDYDTLRQYSLKKMKAFFL